MSAATFAEAGVVLDRRRPGSLDRLATGLEIQVFAVDGQQADIAREAYRKFGKGSGHPAGLNFGDCFTYALAKVLDDAIICKGSDFPATDINCVDY